MPHLFSRYPQPALGMTSFVLAVIALLLAFLPILGIPLSVCGVVIGAAAFITALFIGGSNLRWGLAGLAASGLALAVNLAIAFAPGSEVPSLTRPEPWQPTTDNAYVAPPSQ
jgi:hypothetical protein